MVKRVAKFPPVDENENAKAQERTDTAKTELAEAEGMEQEVELIARR